MFNHYSVSNAVIGMHAGFFFFFIFGSFETSISQKNKMSWSLTQSLREAVLSNKKKTSIQKKLNFAEALVTDIPANMSTYYSDTMRKRNFMIFESLAGNSHRIFFQLRKS